jgi:hypothetical protein
MKRRRLKMGIGKIPADISKIDRDDALVTFLDTTPAGNSRTWALLGVGITAYAIEYNPQVDTEKWIIEKNARTDHTSNQKQGDVTQKMYKGDPCYEFAKDGRDVLNYKTHILDIDGAYETSGSYPAKMSDGLLAITSYGGENAEIGYSLYYEGDPTEGTVTIADGVPTFTPTL